MSTTRDVTVDQVLKMVAPGTQLRDGIERIIGAGRGALIVIGWNEEVASVVSGGFIIDADLTSQHLAELAKMDGAIIVDRETKRIVRANVHLVPGAGLPTSETGTRHRSAERTARHCHVPVVSVSESMRLVTLYFGNRKRQLEDIGSLLIKANQALQTLERYRSRVDEVTATLSAREVEDNVTLRDVVVVLQRVEMVRRIAEEVGDYVVELGSEGRLIRLQLEELVSRVDDDRELLVRDYIADRRRKASGPIAELDAMSTEELLELDSIARALGYNDGDDLEMAVAARGFRLLSKMPRLPDTIVIRLVQTFASLPRMLHASIDELTELEGVGEARARMIREGLRRLAASSVRDRVI